MRCLLHNESYSFAIVRYYLGLKALIIFFFLLWLFIYFGSDYLCFFCYAEGVERSQAQTSDNGLPPLPPLKKRKLTRKPSDVWNHFEKFDTGNASEPIRVRCKYCKTADYKYDPANCGTSSLRKHINFLCQKYPYRVPGSKQKVLSFEKDKCGGFTTLGAVGF